MSVFDSKYKQYDRWYDEHEFVYLSEVEALKKVVPRNKKGLEIGVGTGRFAEKLGISLGIDPSLKMINIAKRRGISVCLGVGEDLSFWQDEFDYVVIIIALCFVNDPLKVLTEARRVLKEKGKLILGIVDKQSFLGKFYRGKKSLFYKKATFFSVKQLTDWLEELGFKQIRYQQTIFNLPQNIKSLQKPKEGFGEGGFVVISAK